MSVVLMQSFTNGDQEKIQEYFSRHMMSTQFSFDKKSSLSHLRYETPQIFIYQTREVDNSVKNFIKEIKKTNFDRPIIIIANETESADYLLKTHGRMIHVLKAPFELKKLVKLCRKLLINPGIHPQKHTRHKTDMHMELEGVLNGQTYSSKMRNLSFGGVYCELECSPTLTKGDIVKINVKLDEVNTSRVLNGRVVWMNKKTVNSTRTGVGIQFIKDHEVYEALLN